MANQSILDEAHWQDPSALVPNEVLSGEAGSGWIRRLPTRGLDRWVEFGRDGASWKKFSRLRVII